MNRIRTQMVAAAAALTAALATLTACSAAGGATQDPTTPADPAQQSCESAAPSAIDRSSAVNARRPVVLLVLAGDKTTATRNADTVLNDASNRGATLLIRGAAAATPALPLAGLGHNPTERHMDRCRRLAAARQQVSTALAASPEPASATRAPDVLAGIKGGLDEVQALPGYTPANGAEHDDVVVLGAAQSGGPIPLTGEAVDRPADTVRAVAAAGLARTCTRWGFTFISPDTEQSRPLAIGLRAFWRQYARTCGGALVGWSATFDGIGTHELQAPLQPSTTPAPIPSPSDPHQHVLLASALFAVDSAELSSGANAALAPVITDARTAAHVTVTGFTDATTVAGDLTYNQRLSLARAQAVAAALRAAGVHARIEARGLGAAHPVAPDTDTQRYRNRRVEVTVLRQ